MSIKIGDQVRTGVYVLGEWRPMRRGVVVSQSFDGTVSGVDVGSLHGAAPWVFQEQTSHLRKIEATPAGSELFAAAADQDASGAR